MLQSLCLTTHSPRRTTNPPDLQTRYQNAACCQDVLCQVPQEQEACSHSKVTLTAVPWTVRDEQNDPATSFLEPLFVSLPAWGTGHPRVSALLHPPVSAQPFPFSRRNCWWAPGAVQFLYYLWYQFTGTHTGLSLMRKASDEREILPSPCLVRVELVVTSYQLLSS